MKKSLSFSLFFTYLLVSTDISHARSGGPPDGYAGNPPNNRTCVSCHSSFGLNSGQGSLELSDLPEAYEPDGEYEFSVTLADPNATRWGFELTAIDSENDRAGNFAVIDRNNTQLSRPGGDRPEYMKQTSAGTRRGQQQSATWDVQWTAPAEDIGEVRFYFTGNAANNNGGTNGDRIYSSSYSMEPAVAEAELLVEMEGGWNMISINVMVGDDFYADEDDEGPDVVLMTDQLRIDDDTHNLILMKDGSGRFYSPDFGFTNIPHWDVASGYQIKLREDADAVWSGEPIPADEEISMDNGWNLIAYYPTYELSAESGDFYVLSPIIDQVITAKDGDGNFMIPGFDFSNMPPWRQSQGYLVKLDGEADFSYPEEEDDRVQSVVESNHQSPGLSPIQTNQNMSILVENIPDHLNSSDVSVIAYNHQGIIVGSGAISAGRSGLAVWGDDPTTEVVDGLQEIEGFELYYHNLSDGADIKLEILNVLNGVGLIYTKDSFLAIEADEHSFNLFNYALSEPYPNPFNSTTMISYSLSHASLVSLQIYDIQGKQVSNLFEGYKQAGTHSLNFTANDLSSGFYFVRLEIMGKVSSRRILLIK